MADDTRSATKKKQIVDALHERVADVIGCSAKRCRVTKKDAIPENCVDLVKVGKELGAKIIHRYGDPCAKKVDWYAKYLYRGTSREVIAYRPLSTYRHLHRHLSACLAEHVLRTDSIMLRILEKSGNAAEYRAAFLESLTSPHFAIVLDESLPAIETQQEYAQAA